ncbi:hypothetical protein QVD99_004652 [Batrachochytrium dendrobatidis]|nr:hypothetical protein QVD99_004652 [Batrachochytrium dendrobatidis]
MLTSHQYIYRTRWRSAKMQLIRIVMSFMGMHIVAGKGVNYTGINESGLENPLNPLSLSQVAITRLVAKGANLIRIPILWESIQPAFHGSLNATYLRDLDTALGMALGNSSSGVVAVIDVHNNATFGGVTFGNGGANVGAFGDLWGRLGGYYQQNSSVWFGLMNAPNMQTGNCSDSVAWLPYAQKAVTSIRQAGAVNKILIPSGQSSTAEQWQGVCKNGDIMNQIVDTASNYVFDVQQYFSSETVTTYGNCGKTTAVVDGMTDWLRLSNRSALLSSFAVNWDDATCVSMLSQYLRYFDTNNDVWLGWAYWSGGPLVPKTTGYYYIESQSNATDSSLLTVLSTYFANRSTASSGTTDVSGGGTASGVVLIVCVVVVGVSLLICLTVILVLRAKAKRSPTLAMIETDSAEYKPAKKRINTDRKSMMEERELRDAVKKMMMNHSVPAKDKAKGKAGHAQSRMRLDAASATETFQAKNVNLKETDSGQFSHFVNFTSSRFQVESQMPNNDDSYLF